MNGVTESACCPEPYHEHITQEKAHRWHHLKERAICLSCCTALHFALEFYSHFWSK